MYITIILVVMFIMIINGIKLNVKRTTSSLLGFSLGLSISQSTCWQYSMPSTVYARNLPTSNEATGKNIGKLEALKPIVEMATIVNKAISDLPNIVNVNNDLKQLPNGEKEFKKLFDEYSEAVSYKQIFLDQNAFLVYYTKGFDGPNRQNIEIEDMAQIREKGQYGARNDAWIAIDDARSEVTYLIENGINDVKDLTNMLKSANIAFDNYFQYANADDVKTARGNL